MQNKNFKSAGSIDSLVPHNSGLYCICISDINKLPKPFNKILTERQHNIIKFNMEKIQKLGWRVKVAKERDKRKKMRYRK